MHTHTSLQHEIAHTHMALLLAGVMAAGNYIGPICPDGTYDCVQTIYEAIAELNSKGTTTLVDDPAKVDDGVAAAKDADVVVLLASNAKDGGRGLAEGECANKHERAMGRERSWAVRVRAAGLQYVPHTTSNGRPRKRCFATLRASPRGI